MTIQKTIAIIAFPNCGTTMLAGIMECFGIPMTGENRWEGNWEDKDIVWGLRDGYFDKTVAERNAQYDIWGFKAPYAFDFLEKTKVGLRNPVYLAIWKDPYSVAQRRFDNTDIVETMQTTLNLMSMSVRKMEESEIDVHMLSYQRALSNPSEFINKMLGIVDIEVTKEQIARANEFIVPNTTSNWRYPHKQVVRY